MQQGFGEQSEITNSFMGTDFAVFLQKLVEKTTAT
jgi:hypothetical protein